MNNASIHIKRKKGFSDLLRAYKIFLDGRQIGVIRHGKSFSCEVSPGQHEVFLTIDWASSQRLSFVVAQGETIQLTCQATNPLLAAFNATFDTQHYIQLYQEP